MPYHLAPYIGSGTRQDPFRPRGSDQPGWRAIDLRPHASVIDGFCILYLPQDDPDPLVEKFANDREETVSNAIRNRIRSRLNLLDLEETEVAQIVHRILTRPPVNGWNRLLPNLQDRYEIYLDGLLSDIPVVTAIATDNFNRANETPIAAPWTRLTGGTGNINLSGNQVVASADGDKFYYYLDAAITTTQYSEIKQITQTGGGDFGPAVRIGSDGFSGYFAHAFDAGEGIAKFVAGAFSTIATVTVDVVNADIVRVEAEGSTIRYKVNNSQVTGSPATDTSLTTAGNGVGLFVFSSGDTLDDWIGGDLVVDPIAIEDPMLVASTRFGPF